MQKLKRGTLFLLLALLFGFGIYSGLRIAHWSAGPSRIYSSPALLKQIQTLSELVTVKYVIEKTEVWNDPPKNILAAFVAGDNHILLVARGIVKAGVDLSELRPDDLQVHEKSIIATLPPSRVTDCYLDDKETKVIERSTGFLRSFDKDLEQNIRATTVEDIRGAAVRGGIRQEADERAKTQLKALFLQLGFEHVEFRSRPPIIRRDDAASEKSPQ